MHTNSVSGIHDEALAVVFDILLENAGYIRKGTQRYNHHCLSATISGVMDPFLPRSKARALLKKGHACVFPFCDISFNLMLHTAN